MGLTATSAAKRSSGAVDDAEDGGGCADHGRDPRGRACEHDDRGQDEHEYRDGERGGEQAPRAGREHKRLGLRPAEQSEPSPCEPAPGDHPHLQHEHAGGGRRGQGQPGHQASDEQLSIHPRPPPLHPDPQASGLVVLELEQMKHEMEPPGDQDEQAETRRR